MTTLTILQTIWFLLIGVLLAGYAVLDGFDLGIGSLLPYLTRFDEKKAPILFNAIGPFWDGNEVWLITGGGALFAAFPHAYATVFSGFYLALMLLLLALILRAVSLEFFTLEANNKKIWMATFVFGSILPSILFGVALGNIIMGIPLDVKMEYTGGFFTLLRPYPLVIGLLGFTAILMQGVTYTLIKVEGFIYKRAKDIHTKIWYFYGAMFIISMIMSFIFIPSKMSNIFAWISATVFILSFAGIKYSYIIKDDIKAFIASSCAFISLWGIVGAIQFPVLVRSVDNEALNITIFNASSSSLTLKVMLGIALVGMPIVIAYIIYVYRLFKGKVVLKH